VREFPTGPKNSITDIKGVRVGHLTISKDFQDELGEKIFIRTGLTAVVPCEMEKEKRLFAGFFALRGNNEITGYEVKDDFCYLNSPLVLSNSYNVGKVYNAILSYGFSLGRSEVWPPVVLGVDDSWLSDMNMYSLTENQAVQLLHNSPDSQVEEGSVGIGLGLRAWGWKGGIGTSSRIFSLSGKKFSLGVLAASNHGNKPDSQRKSSVKKSDSFQAKGSLMLILAVDIPLVPFQIQHIASSIVVSLPSINTLNNCQDSVICFLFSTANAMSLKNGGPLVFDYSLIADSTLERIVRAGADAAREAILRSLLLADSVEGRLGREVKTIPDNEFKKILGLFGSLS
jgi:D-aminopeptidase